MDPYAAQITESEPGVLHAAVPTRNTPYLANGYTTPYWNEAVLYEIHIPTFTTDATNPRDQAGMLELALSRDG